MGKYLIQNNRLKSCLTPEKFVTLQCLQVDGLFYPAGQRILLNILVWAFLLAHSISAYCGTLCVSYTRPRVDYQLVSSASGAAFCILNPNKLAMSKRTTEEFISLAKIKHGDKYDYSKVEYVDKKTKVCIICPEHGEFWQTPDSHLQGKGCRLCGWQHSSQIQMKSAERFIEQARTIHRDKYDYTNVVYKNDKTSVEIICPEHGVFQQKPNKHLQGRGCPLCAVESRKRLKYGVAVNDMRNQEGTKCYAVWDGILQRCFGSNRLKHNPSYADCSVCNEWLTYSNFKRWFDAHYVEGYELDKDIFRRDDKTYSPETCVFIPGRLNSMLNRMADTNGGVMKNTHTYAVSTTIDGEHYYKGGYRTEDEAHRAYVLFRCNRIFEVASQMWSRHEIDDRTYIALSQKLACANTGRRGIGIELMQEYYDIAVKRVKDAQAQLKLEI